MLSIKARRAERTCGFLFLIMAAWAILPGCASMNSSGSYQSTLIRTSPPGASIYVGGVKVARSPDFVDIRRKSRPSIEIETASGREEYELPTRYRWSYFWRNFVFLTYAPIGWITDFVTGAAWDVRDPEVIPVQLAIADAKNPKPARARTEIAIAPPRSSSIALSDAAGRALESKLRAMQSNVNVQPYQNTLPVFVGGGYEYGDTEGEARRKIQRTLRADVIYEASVEPDQSGWTVKSEAWDAATSATNPGPSFHLDRDQDGSRVLGTTLWQHPWWSRVMPNTLGLDFVNEQMRMELNNQNYDLAPVAGEEWWATGLRYLSAINISSTPDRRREYGSRWEFSAVPNLRVSRRSVKITGLPPSSTTFTEREPQFTRWSVAGGYGLEVGYLMGRHYIYLDAIPMFSWGQIKWRQDAQDYSTTRTGVVIQGEIGYSYSFESNWLIRIFSRSQSEDVALWSEAMKSRLGETYVPTSTTAVVSGVTIGYRFNTDKFK